MSEPRRSPLRPLRVAAWCIAGALSFGALSTVAPDTLTPNLAEFGSSTAFPYSQLLDFPIMTGVTLALLGLVFLGVGVWRVRAEGTAALLVFGLAAGIAGGVHIYRAVDAGLTSPPRVVASEVSAAPTNASANGGVGEAADGGVGEAADGGVGETTNEAQGQNVEGAGVVEGEGAAEGGNVEGGGAVEGEGAAEGGNVEGGGAVEGEGAAEGGDVEGAGAVEGQGAAEGGDVEGAGAVEGEGAAEGGDVEGAGAVEGEGAAEGGNVEGAGAVEGRGAAEGQNVERASAAAVESTRLVLAQLNVEGDTAVHDAVVRDLVRAAPDVVVIANAGEGYAQALVDAMVERKLGPFDIQPTTGDLFVVINTATTSFRVASIGRISSDKNLDALSQGGALVLADGAGTSLYAVAVAERDRNDMAPFQRDIAAVGSMCGNPGLIIVGDLSTSMASGPLKHSQCRDAATALGHGAAGTWPASVPAWLGVPRAHVLLSRDNPWQPEAIASFEIPRSSHRGLVVTLNRLSPT